jgi:UDP-N-acetylmuramoyl-L-alanyl-D-glutamate--2,6-diaminopimelate ligase
MKASLLLGNIVNDSNLKAEFANMMIEGISCNSAKVSENDVFAAISGFKHDGHTYIADAISAGAALIIGEKEIGQLPVPYLQVSNSRQVLAKMACAFYGYPSKKHIMIGITGTNGKTTTSFMLRHILEEAGFSCALFGSVMNVVNGEITSSTQTTIDSLELQKQLAESNDDIAIIEVSSHGLSQFRVEGVEFDFCLFTNLDQDHLDYHGDMESYFAVKAGLFTQLKQNGKAIINHYNSWGEKLADQLANSAFDLLIVGKEQSHHLQIGKYKAKMHTYAELFEKDKQHELKLEILGVHNIYNAALSFLTAQQLGLSSSAILQSLSSFKGVPGRFEQYQHPSGAKVIVDYAHTADAFFHCLSTAKEIGAKRIFHIFGFRGGRDETKRQNMASVSAEWSDQPILTLDDLNGVSIEEMTQTLEEIKTSHGGKVIHDRTLAIQYAWNEAEEGDWIFITGKGTEAYQQIFTLPVNSDPEAVQYLQQNS